MIINFEDRANKKEVGGKGESLLKLTEAGFSVPHGFIVTTKMQESFFDRNGITKLVLEESKNLDSNNYAEFINAAKRIRREIINGVLSDEELKLIQNALKNLEKIIPEKSLYAVRSSAGKEDGKNESWAGQFDSFLGVCKDDIPNYIKRCWASMFSARAIKYGKEKRDNDKMFSFAVIVQQMIEGEYSGIAFSIDPEDINQNHVRIESVPGTGESAVGGQEIPYAVILGKDDGVIIKRYFGSQGRVELIKPSLLKKIMDEVIKIEKIYRMPVDVEWTIKDNNIYILQARPITAEISDRIKSKKDLPDILDYQMTFKVSGLGFMFADLLCRGFGYLHPLFICNKGEFLQYFTNERMEYAARYGHRWLSTENGFLDYRKKFSNFHKDKYVSLRNIIDEKITQDRIKEFFDYIYEYFIFYSKMDFQFTNLTYLYAEENSIIATNLSRIAEFKDIARVWVNSVSINDDCLLNQLLKKISKEFDVSTDKLELYKITEILELFNGKKIDDKILFERSENSLVYIDGQIIKYVWGEKAVEYIEQVKLVYNAQASADIIGQIANKGSLRFVTGKVSLINVDYSNIDLMEYNISKMEQGDILVSEFTAPELIGACNKAKAIITDLGGMLSHAAIVSRELNIPCIVGTEHASRSLQNGDIIRIDTELGIVEKI